MALMALVSYSISGADLRQKFPLLSWITLLRSVGSAIDIDHEKFRCKPAVKKKKKTDFLQRELKQNVMHLLCSVDKMR